MTTTYWYGGYRGGKGVMRWGEATYLLTYPFFNCVCLPGFLFFFFFPPRELARLITYYICPAAARARLDPQAIPVPVLLLLLGNRREKKEKIIRERLYDTRSFRSCFLE